MTKRTKSLWRVIASEYAFSQKPLEERMRLDATAIAKKNKRLSILAGATGHTPDDLFLNGWVSNSSGEWDDWKTWEKLSERGRIKDLGKAGKGRADGK